MGPALASLIGAGFGAVGNYFSARSAQRFSERMSSTAHQREVRDMMAAGINPMLSGRGSGASSPQGVSPEVAAGAERGVASALAARNAKANAELLEAQGAEVRQRTKLQEAQVGEVGVRTRAGEQQIDRTRQLLPLDIAAARVAVNRAMFDYETQGQMRPLLLERARAEIKSTLATAARTDVLRELDDLSRTGAGNIQQFEERIGEAGPWTRLFFEFLRRVR